MARVILILGGARSGKSRFAQQLAARLGGDDVLFVATAEAGDQEMRDRIAHHRSARPNAWQTVESPRNVGATLERATCDTVVIDCLTLLVSNTLLQDGDSPAAQVAQQRVADETERLLAACRRRSGHVLVVSGEVGLGIVPETPLGRLYRDCLGWMNQAIAAEADATYLLVAGLPINLKPLTVAIDEAAATGTEGNAS